MKTGSSFWLVLTCISVIQKALVWLAAIWRKFCCTHLVARTRSPSKGFRMQECGDCKGQGRGNRRKTTALMEDLDTNCILKNIFVE